MEIVPSTILIEHTDKSKNETITEPRGVPVGVAYDAEMPMLILTRYLRQVWQLIIHR